MSTNSQVRMYQIPFELIDSLRSLSDIAIQVLKQRNLSSEQLIACARLIQISSNFPWINQSGSVFLKVGSYDSANEANYKCALEYQIEIDENTIRLDRYESFWGDHGPEHDIQPCVNIDSYSYEIPSGPPHIAVECVDDFLLTLSELVSDHEWELEVISTIESHVEHIAWSQEAIDQLPILCTY